MITSWKFHKRYIDTWWSAWITNLVLRTCLRKLFTESYCVIVYVSATHGQCEVPTLQNADK